MPPPNPKNAALGPAATDLGLGMPLGDEALLDEDERRKKLKRDQQAAPAQFGDSVLGNAAMSLFTGMANTK